MFKVVVLNKTDKTVSDRLRLKKVLKQRINITSNNQIETTNAVQILNHFL